MMPKIPSLVLGTRGSRLALAQTQLVVDALKERYPHVDVRLQIFITKGDINQSPIPLDAVGKDWFTAEIEQALLKKEIDGAIHSMKDLSPETPHDLVILPVLERGDPRDVLISKSGLSLKDLPQGATIGTDSARRKVLLLEMRPDIVVKSIRGNVDTRIKKLREEAYDAIVLAAAGLERVGMLKVATEFLDPVIFIPAIGQGILAAQARRDRGEVLDMFRTIQHIATNISAEAERIFSSTIGGGCKVPIGCYARVERETVFMDAFIKNARAAGIRRKSASGATDSTKNIAESLARALLG
jgi:hydroxymethylbilane synthase